MINTPNNDYETIEGTKVVNKKDGDPIRIINSESTQNGLRSKGLEIGKTYKLDGPENPTMTIAGISDGKLGFSPELSISDLQKIQGDTAAVWGYAGDENNVCFCGYLKNLEPRTDGVEGFTMRFNGMLAKYRKTDDRVISATEHAGDSAMNLL